MIHPHDALVRIEVLGRDVEVITLVAAYRLKQGAHYAFALPPPASPTTLAELPHWIEHLCRDITNPSFNYSRKEIVHALRSMLAALNTPP